MFIELTVGNFRSFKERATLSMVAAKLNARDPQLDLNNTFQVDEDLSLLTSAGIYGANASGKSNLIKALGFMRHYVLSSSRESQADEPIDTVPFKLDSQTELAPSYFEVVFRLEGVPYRYGFEVTTEKVETEWLFYSPNRKEAKLFTREDSEFSISRALKGGQALKSLTRPNALFLSVAAQFNNEIAKKVLGWFKRVNVISGLDDSAYGGFTAKAFAEDESYRAGIVELLQESDVGINNVVVEKINVHEAGVFPKNMPQELRDFLLKQVKDEGEFINFRAIHRRHCENDVIEDILFNLDEESEGTQKLFFLSGPVINTLREGKVLVIDEIEARLHTLLTRKLIGLFSSEKTNPKHAQLIFATHDTNLLSNKLFRRDQIWFVEKDEEGASHLYSLAELKVRNDASFESDYLQGKYGAIPILGEMRRALIELSQEDGHEIE
ncbi:AAA family ATPase [Levilinea saccharolytica]|uniref:ATPase AAA-type core domain-containing protein n=1 Tax=Levilinea saccharolytica TaxID=229921 RepID=A0A0P6Y4A3_9CHLR|nr:ATP-binding protein [Levilinea saccharolytica]KPL90867.1 hypothetical protein ADN01_02095 [Levilinea saccharolytica]GAP18979.1 protein containing AAA domain [Levilinea saccharolytica]